MKTRGGRFLLLIGAGLAVMAFVLVYIFMSRGIATETQAAAVPTEVPMARVAVVNTDIPAYTVLDASNVVVDTVEQTTVQSNTASDASNLYGKMTLVNLTKGQQIPQNLLADSGFSSVIEKGQKAFSFAVPERSTFGGAVTVNDRVDVLWTIKLDYNKRVPQPGGQYTFEKVQYANTKTLIQDIAVLRVLKLAPPPPPPAENGEAQQAAAAAPPNYNSAEYYVEGAPFTTVLVLGMTDQQAEVLKFARENGSVDLALRSSAVLKNPDGSVVKDANGVDVKGDRDPETTTGITIDDLIATYGIKAPVEQP